MSKELLAKFYQYNKEWLQQRLVKNKVFPKQKNKKKQKYVREK